jgi:glutathione synthase/RimK-type ligase-like ATP-grasp enzyme
MAVMAREVWTDERLDDLNARVERGFEEVKGEIHDVKAEVLELRKETKAGFDAVNIRIDSMHRTMIICFVTLFASIGASVVGAVLAAQL